MLTKLQSPYRSPMVIVDAVKRVIKDKSVCDLGCGCGDILLEMSKYAKGVFGIERDGDRVATARTLGLDVVQGDVLGMDIPKFDVYYLWIVPGIIKKVLDRIEEGTIILGADTIAGEDIVIEGLNLKGRWIEVPYNEGDGWRQRGTFKLFITKK